MPRHFVQHTLVATHGLSAARSPRERARLAENVAGGENGNLAVVAAAAGGKTHKVDLHKWIAGGNKQGEMKYQIERERERERDIEKDNER